MRAIYFQPRLLLIGVLGFYSGLPLALTAATLTAWLSDAGVDRTAIGLFAAIATPYALKFLWAPVLDGVRIPVLYSLLGRRRSWLLVAQILLAVALAAMVFTNPAATPQLTALVGFIVAALSATQDTVIDAYRVERLMPHEQGAGAATATFGYRLGMLVSGAGALYLADRLGWETTYLVMAAIAATAIPFTLLARSTDSQTERGPAPGFREFLRDSVAAPFADFLTRPFWPAVIAFVILYKLGDAMIGNLFNPFLLDIGFSKTQIAEIVKLYGLAATLAGSFLGGWLVARYGMFRVLLLGGIVHSLSNFLLIVQLHRGADTHMLILTITLINFTGGPGIVAFVAYLSALCRQHYTATQYALLSSLSAVGRTWLSTPSGWLVGQGGWEGFFILASLMSLPGLLVLVWLESRQRRLTPT